MSSVADAPVHDADVLVLGASFAGIEVVHQLVRMAGPRRLRTVVIDRQRSHGYLPLVQERLVGRLPVQGSELATAAYLDSIPDVRFVEGEIVGLGVDARTVELADCRRFSARAIVVALGSTLAPPPEIEGREHLLSHKSSVEFARLRSELDRVLAGDEPEPRIVVVGGGLSAVELAAELACIRGFSPRPWPHPPTITLVARGPRLLPQLAPRVGARALAVLQSQGVEVKLGATLVAANPEGVLVREGEAEVHVPCALALWAGGVRPAPILGALGLPLRPDGWLAVGPTLQCFTMGQGPEELFACGDGVRVVGGDGEWPTMQRAIECIWQAKVVARNLLTLLGQAPGFPDGVPPLRPHRLRRSFFYGVSLGRRSLVVRGPLVLDLPGVNQWFRRWLMRQYFVRYTPWVAAG